MTRYRRFLSKHKKDVLPSTTFPVEISLVVMKLVWDPHNTLVEILLVDYEMTAVLPALYSDKIFCLMIIVEVCKQLRYRNSENINFPNLFTVWELYLCWHARSTQLTSLYVHPRSWSASWPRSCSTWNRIKSWKASFTHPLKKRKPISQWVPWNLEVEAEIYEINQQLPKFSSLSLK